MTYAFTFDASACSGCKACQVACKDKNNLPLGVLWRRVYEVSGGSWQKHGDAWVTDVFAYSLSIACNHCVHPKCAGVCPTDAYIQREDGIVYIDESKCMGCGYCSWACPYAAPRYNPALGYMTKCNFCYDNLDAGLPPACVAACPTRVLDYVSIPSHSFDGDQRIKPLWEIPGDGHPFPLPRQSRTEPHLAILPHAAMSNPLEKKVSNFEEIEPSSSKSEWPLVIFTLLGQTAAGMAFYSFFSGPLSVPVLLAMGGLIGFGGLASLLHLGNPVNAWRSVTHLKKSWLSREILMFGIFGVSWFIALAMPGMGKFPLAASGIGFVYSMAQVYRLRSIPAWDSYRPLLAFAVSALLLGGTSLVILNISTNMPVDDSLLFALTLCLAVVFVLTSTGPSPAYRTAYKFRLGLIGLGLIGLVSMFITPPAVGRWITIFVFAVVLIEEGIGRWLFYEPLHQRTL